MRTIAILALPLALAGCIGTDGVGPLDPFLQAATPTACRTAKYYLDIAAATKLSAKEAYNVKLARGEIETFCAPGVAVTAVAAVRLADAARVLKGIAG